MKAEKNYSINDVYTVCCQSGRDREWFDSSLSLSPNAMNKHAKRYATTLYTHFVEKTCSAFHWLGVGSAEVGVFFPLNHIRVCMLHVIKRRRELWFYYVLLFQFILSLPAANRACVCARCIFLFVFLQSFYCIHAIFFFFVFCCALNRLNRIIIINGQYCVDYVARSAHTPHRFY